MLSKKGEDISDAAEFAKRLRTETKTEHPDDLPPTVASADERRCPFFQTDSGKSEAEVDDVCDVRIQRFSDTPPFGPTDLDICKVCIAAKAHTLEVVRLDMAEEMADEAEEASRAQGGPRMHG